MKTPSFWSEKNLLSTLLLPFSIAYDMGSTLRRVFTKPVTLPVPVICVGNLTAGGAGKTPVALHVGKLLKEKNINAFFLSRGYGGRLTGPIQVNPAKHTARDVGDEPLLLVKVLPTVIARDRLSGARLAISQGAKAIVMDDGFQNPTIAKTLSLIVIDGKHGFGNDRVIPSGPLREQPDAALNRAHVAIVINRTAAMPALPLDFPVLYAKTQPGETEKLRGRKLVAFCGIAYPQNFFDMLTRMGVSPAECVTFPDHHPYTLADCEKLVARANAQDAGLVTTAKDFVRLPSVLQNQVSVVNITLAFEGEAMLHTILDFALNEKA